MAKTSEKLSLSQIIREWLSYAKQASLYQLSPVGRASRRQLTDMMDSHRAERCFIIGNGPSLRQTDLTKLRDEFTFGLNRIYLLFPELGFPTTYLVTVNWLVLEQCANEILALPTTRFLPWRFRRYLDPEQRSGTIFIQTDRTGPAFTHDARHLLWAGATVTYVAMQLAYHMGFQKVILVGIDHSFSTQGKPHEAVVSQGDDPNHFSPNYFGKGFRWQLPDLETSEIAYHLARKAFEADGREIVDATIGGKLTVFPKAEYQDLFK
ncbi:MAG TPA: 6-hydroxymethylpterin diphosphokinase MptE-like protein [Anaerolineales bacterium]